MKNVVKDIEINCPECNTKEIIDFLYKNGDISYKSDEYREIYFFYKECRKQKWTHRESRRTTMELFNIPATKFKRVMRRFRDH